MPLQDSFLLRLPYPESVLGNRISRPYRPESLEEPFRNDLLLLDSAFRLGGAAN